MYNYYEELNQINVNDMYELFGVDVDLKENKKDYNEEHNNINLSDFELLQIGSWSQDYDFKKQKVIFYAQSATRTHALAERDLNPPE